MTPTGQELVSTSGDRPGIGGLVHRITDDVKAIASDEVELARAEVNANIRKAVLDAGVVVLGAVVALIGLGLLCVVVVVALEPLISSLAIRLLLMAVVYLAIGGATAAVFAKLLGRGTSRMIKRPVEVAKQTAAEVKAALGG